MTVPPTGTVTFLCTDVEGSTRQAQADSAAWSAARARHHQIVRAAIEAHEGFVFAEEGDGFYAAFSTVGQGIAAALAAQRGLQHESWPAASVRARMGVHTGTAVWHADGYEGYLTLARAQRVMSVAHGAQVLLSGPAADLAITELPPGVGLRDLGEHPLKDLAHPEHLYQLVAPDLASEFPPLRTLESHANNLPVQLTTFIGRERELGELKPLLSSSRLLTLTGAGGTGKTRLALELAGQVLDTFADGAWLIELAAISEPGFVAQRVAVTLGLREEPGRAFLDMLRDFVRTKNVLLILDNCEQIIGAAAQLADALLRAGAAISVLATSRESLGITGETAYRVPSLPVPDPIGEPDLGRLAENDCVRLFVDRATAADPHFYLTLRNAAAVSEICRHLDGIPLAIELAAARVTVFPPEQIAAHLDDRFRLLTGGDRTAVERHQTLLALIDWSHDLLSEPERVLLRRLSVLTGGWSFEAAEAIAGDGLDDSVVATIAGLANKSMIVVEALVEAGEGRYRLLETIREYARDKLLEAGETPRTRDRHLEYFVRFAETIEPKLRGGDQVPALQRTQLEHDNLRTALAWSLERSKTDRTLRLAGALSYFWELRGYLTEGQKWLEQAIALPATGTDANKAARAKVLYALARFHFATRIDVPESRAMAEEALQSWRELGDRWWMGVALEHIGYMLRLEGDFEAAVERLREGVALARHVDDRWPLALCLVRLAGSLVRTDVNVALRTYEEGVGIARELGDMAVLSQGLVGLAGAHFLYRRNLDAAQPIAEEALITARAAGSVTNDFLALFGLAALAALRGDRAKAKGYAEELLTMGRNTGSTNAHVLGIFTSGVVASFTARPEQGVRMLAAAQALAGQRGMNVAVVGGQFRMLLQEALEKARAQVDPATFSEALEAGRMLTMEQALALATES